MTTGASMGKLPGYPIGSVDKALRLLLLFRERSTLRLSEAAAEIGVAVSTAHRLLAMLQYHGFVFQDERSRLYVSSMDVRSVARPHLERLCFEVDETVHLAILEGTHVRYVDSAEPSKPLRVASRTGQRLPAHATAVGKLLLSYLEPAQLEALLPGRLEGLTPRTITSRTKLVRELKERRAQGWAQNTGEAEEDISSIAVAIVDERVGARGALSVAAPTFRFDDALVQRYVAAARATAAAISDALANLPVSLDN